MQIRVMGDLVQSPPGGGPVALPVDAAGALDQGIEVTAERPAVREQQQRTSEQQGDEVAVVIERSAAQQREPLPGEIGGAQAQIGVTRNRGLERVAVAEIAGRQESE